MKLDTAILTEGREIKYIPEIIGQGASKRVYFTEDKSSVVCFYKDPDVDFAIRRKRLESIVGRFNPTLNDKHASYWKKLFCWPTGIVEKPSIGIVCPAYPKTFLFESGVLKGKEKKGEWFWGEKASQMVDPDERGTWRDFLAGCIVLARAVGRLHRAGLAHSDLSQNNVLLDPKSREAIVIDIDTLVVPEVYDPNVLGTPGYIAPEVISTIKLPVGDPSRKLPCIQTDRHALPTLIYQYLLFRHPLIGPKIHSEDPNEDELLSQGKEALFIEDPSDISNRRKDISVPFTSLGKPLSDLFLSAFVDGLHDPDRRPNATQWEGALLKTWDLIWSCENNMCTHKSFVLSDINKVRCPWCGTQPPYDTIPVLNLLKESRGQLMQDGQLVASPNSGLRIWHVYDNVQRVPDLDGTRQAYFAFHNGKWMMINEKLQGLTSSDGLVVAPGEAVVLTDGARIGLSSEPHGRVAEVKLIKVL